MPPVSLAAPAVAAPGELLEAIHDAQQATVLHLVPEAIRHGLSAHQFWPLYHLARGPESHPGELARRLGITAPACTASVDQLVAAGFVARRASTTDRRRVVLAVTPKGRRTLEAVWRRFDGAVRDAAAGLPTADVEISARVLATIAARLREDVAAGREGVRA
jgi:DNA-binding MarR family transcriptional regulator